MNNYFKYLTHNQEDESWGIYLTVSGNAKVIPNTSYPPQGHPTGYNFRWDYGRVLHEYQLIYITDGEGIIETKEGNFSITEGSVILIRPSVWHRYQPLKSKGWKEHYVGFNGSFVEHLLLQQSTIFNSPVIQLGFNDELIQLFIEIMNDAKTEKPGYHQIGAGLVMYILGLIVSIKKNENFSSSKIESIIQKACIIIRENIEKNIVVEQLANDLDIGYSIFRKSFKEYTGLSPVQYHLSLRIKQAINLLTNSGLSVKEVSYQLGFCSVYYFSKLFKEKTGKSPSEYYRK